MYQRAATLIADTANRLTAHADNPHAVAGALAAAADLLTATAAAWEGATGGPLTRAAELFDRAAHEYDPVAPAPTGSGGYRIRAIARLLPATGSAGRHREHRELKAMLSLVRAMAGLATAVADLRDAQRRLHQAHAARASASVLDDFNPPALADRRATSPLGTPAGSHTTISPRSTVRPSGRGAER